MEDEEALAGDKRPSNNRMLSTEADGSGEAGIFEFKAGKIAEIDSDEEDAADSRPQSEEAESRPDTGASSRASTAASEKSERGKGKANKWKATKDKLKAAKAISGKGEGGEASADGQQNGDLTVVDIEDG